MSKRTAPPMAVKGGEDAGHRSSRGGQTTKIHVLTDALGRPAVIRLTPGNVSDIQVADDHADVRSGTTSDATAIAGGSKLPFFRLKDFRRMATRYDKLAANYLAFIELACHSNLATRL